MNHPWESDDCADVQAYYTHYPIPVAAALWCGVPPDRVERILEQCTQVDRAIFAHPKIPCIEPRCRAIHEAINSGVLECRREGREITAGDHVAPERRTVARMVLKEWVAAQFPASKPAFLFDELERKAHSSINADSFQALQADRDALKARIEKTTDAYRTLNQERDALEAERNSQLVMVDNQAVPGERAETTYLNIIGGLLGLLLGQSPNGKPYSSFASQAAVISALLAHHEGKPGVSARTLEEKLAAAKRSLES
jgi:FtsZ-binding cell division protein ZapB